MNNETDNSNEAHSADQSWPERNVNLIIVTLVVACALTVVAQAVWGFVFHPLFDEKHPAHFDIENLLGFQAIFGFVAFIAIVFIGRFLRLIIMRREDYYDS